MMVLMMPMDVQSSVHQRSFKQPQQQQQPSRKRLFPSPVRDSTATSSPPQTPALSVIPQQPRQQSLPPPLQLDEKKKNTSEEDSVWGDILKETGDSVTALVPPRYEYDEFELLFLPNANFAERSDPKKHYVFAYSHKCKTTS